MAKQRKLQSRNRIWTTNVENWMEPQFTKALEVTKEYDHRRLPRIKLLVFDNLFHPQLSWNTFITEDFSRLQLFGCSVKVFPRI
ncbi:unnamed protein product [Leptidea sinapis]|uniref:Uncharacterized protein n=1 Tax=Leptidea sinapis TaxID=189913 RepID=A0A5E4Q5X1_9NEOP|nr:unnamed protein product [Leptidea sinapis]